MYFCRTCEPCNSLHSPLIPRSDTWRTTNNRYDKILTNIGNAYDATSGIFLVPVSGIYSLSASLMGDPNHGIHVQLVKNGIELVRLWTGGAASYELASHTLNINLAQNDKIWVQNRDSGDPIVYATENYNMFSAVLLHEGHF